MKPRHFFLLIGLLLACPALAAEPEYKGKTLCQWQVESEWGDAAARSTAAEALGHFGPKALLALTGISQDRETDVRVAVAGALGHVGAGAVAVLTGLARDREAGVRRSAAWAFWWLGPGGREAVPLLRELLLDDADVRACAALALLRSDPGSTAAVSVLTDLLHESGSDFRADVARALGATGTIAKPVIPALVELLVDKEWNVQSAAEEALKGIGPEAAPELAKLFRKGGTESRGRIAQVLGKFGPDAMPLFRELLRDGDRGARLAVTGGLQNVGPAAISVLIELLRNGDGEIRLAATKSLQDIGPAVVPAVTGLLTHDAKEVRHHVAILLGSLGPDAKAAAPAIAELLSDHDLEVRLAAAWAATIVGCDPPLVIPRLKVMLREKDPNARCEVAEALVRTGAPEGKAAAVAPLIEIVRSKDAGFHRAVADLGWIGPQAKEAIPAVMELLRDTRKLGNRRNRREVRQIAAHALTTMGPEAKAALVPALIEFLASTDPGTRRFALESLQPLVPEARISVPALTALLSDADPGVRVQAAWTVAGIGLPARAAAPALMTLSRDKDKEARVAAAGALAAVGEAAAAFHAVRELLRDIEGTQPLNARTLPDIEVTITASRVLECLGTHKSLVPELIEMMKERGPPGTEAAKALAKVSPEGVSALVDAVQSKDEHLRGTATDALFAIRTGDKATVAVALARLPQGSGWEIRQACATALGELARGSQAATPGLTALLGDRDSAVREAAVRALEHMYEEARPMISELDKKLHDDDWLVREAASETLKQIRQGSPWGVKRYVYGRGGL
jgi:HEAT repeat protein